MSAAKKIDPVIGSLPESKAGWSQRILVVEDQKEIAQSYLDILSPPEIKNRVPSSSRSSRSQSAIETKDHGGLGFQFEIVVVSSAKEAIEKVEESLKEGKSFCMGFIDVLLGEGMDGIELLRLLQEMDQKFYGVLVTAYHDRDINSIYNYLGEAHADRWDYLNKPFTKGEILQKARNFISLWNFKNESEQKAQRLAEVQKQLVDSERFSTVAAVARGVSHEFGNILVQITGKAELGKMGNEHKMKDALEKIFSASLRANDILERFNHLAKPMEQGFEKESISFRSIVDGATDLLDHQLKTAGIKVTHPKSSFAKIYVNHTAILQVVTNLILNSMHAMPHGGQLDFSLEEVANSVSFKIRDYGTGIPEEHLDKVLDAFYSTKGEEGTGLGLSICKEIIEIEHGGSIKLLNHEVKGLVIEILLPKGGAELG